MKSELSRLLQRRRKRRKGDTRELAARLAPLEEQRPAGVSLPSDSAELVTQQKGAIVVGNHKLNLPRDLIEVDARKGFLVLEPVVMVIVGLMLAFIAFIAWRISRM
jgi:hypothetical protein